MSEYKEVEIQWLTDGARIHNFRQMEFCWANKQLQQLLTFTACKDHLQDVIHSHFKGQATIPFGYYVPGTNPAPSFDRARLLVTDTSEGKEFFGIVPKMVDLLNLAEEKLKFRKTKVFKVSNPLQPHMKSGVCLLESSAKWTLSPPMISLYSLLIRSSPGHEIGESLDDAIHALREDTTRSVSISDRHYFSSGMWAIDRILKYGSKIWYPKRKDNFPVFLEYSHMHGLGLCGMSSESEYRNQKGLVPRWYRDIEEKKRKTNEASGS